MRVLDRPLPPCEPASGGQVALAFSVFAAGAVFEEIGWTGYATSALQRRHGIFKAGCMLGAVWALWHVVPWWLHQGHTAGWVIAQGLASVAMRVIMGWLYARGGRSLFLAILFHATINTTYSLFPNGGSAYDPAIMAWVLWLGIGAVGLGSISKTRRCA
jgi:CAAX protease family protein